MIELPRNQRKGKDGRFPEKLILRIDNLGRILVDADEIMVLDPDEYVRTTPLLDTLLRKMKNERGAFTVNIRTDEGVRLVRVIDVLNACTSVDISSVTFEEKVN